MRNGSESVRKKPQVSLPYCIHASEGKNPFDVFRIFRKINTAQALSQQYDVVVTNPPYRGMTDCNKTLRKSLITSTTFETSSVLSCPSSASVISYIWQFNKFRFVRVLIGVLLGDDTSKSALLGDDTQKPLVGRVVQKSLSDEVDKKTPFAIY